MKVDLDTKALRSLVQGTSPYYSAYGEALIKANGYHVGGFVDSWQWNLSPTLTDEELWAIYQICLKSNEE